MKQMMIFCSLMLLWGSCLMAQEPQGMVDDPTDPVFRAQFEQVDFKGNTAVEVLDDASRRYFLVDMTSFPSRFEKIWFLNLVFADDMIVNMDSDLSQDRMWFMAFKTYPKQDVLDHFEALKKKTLDAREKMTSEEKAKWMAKHDKYQGKEER
jgi:hypothetical protein